MILYHGSDHIIEVPQVNGSKRYNDYGPGFYTTKSLDLAKEWACSKNRDGYANQYEFDPSGLRILDLNSPEFSILNWLALLTRYRSYWQKGSISEDAKNYLQEHFFVDPDPFDVIKGYRADDSYFTFAQDFVSGVISYEKLSKAMHLGSLGEQIVLKSPQAFERLQFICAEPAEGRIFYEKKAIRDCNARREYRKTRSTIEDRTRELFILDIMREGMKHGDPRL